MSTPLPELSLSSLSYTAIHYVEREGSRADDSPKFDLEAPYQRASVWTDDQRVALVKSLFMRLPIGTIIIAKLPFKVGRASWRVVDGKQRIEAIRAFAADEFAIPSRWLRDYELLLDPSSMVLYSELAGPGQRRFDNATVSALEFDSGWEWVYEPDHPKAVKRGSPYWTRARSDDEMIAAEAELYGLVNGGGTAQTEADMERAAAIAGGETR